MKEPDAAVLRNKYNLPPGAEQDIPGSILISEMAQLERRIESIENSIGFRMLRATGLRFASSKRRLGNWLLRTPFHALFAGTAGKERSEIYGVWLSQHRLQNLRQVVRAPKFSFGIVMPVFQPNLIWLREAISSVRNQVHPGWRLSMCVDGEVEATVDTYLRNVQTEDSRISVVAGPRIGISGTLNRARERVTCDYLAFLDQDDLLEPAALTLADDYLQTHKVEMLYTDEGIVAEDGRPIQPNFKPGWSPELFVQCMYPGHLLIVSSTCFDDAGGFRSQFDGSQDYDLALRLKAAGCEVGHVPRVLYQWRRHKTSTALGTHAKPWAQEAGRRALEEHLASLGQDANVSLGEMPNTFARRIHRTRSAEVTIIIPTRCAELLDTCVGKLRNVNAEWARIIVIHHLGGPDDEEIVRIAERRGVLRIPWQGSFHFAAMNNVAAEAAETKYLLFLNDDVEPVSPEWLDQMVSSLESPGVGIAGAQLLYPSGTLQHVGIVPGMGEATGHAGRHLVRSAYWPWLQLTRDVSAVTGACLAIRREDFLQAGGFDLSFPVNYNDVDLCLRMRSLGYRVVVNCRAVLLHRESSTRKPGTRLPERLRFRQRWLRSDSADPFYSPHLSLHTEDIELEFEAK